MAEPVDTELPEQPPTHDTATTETRAHAMPL